MRRLDPGMGHAKEGRVDMSRKAIAYVSDVILGRTGEVIRRSAQRELLRQYAEENDIEIVAWFEDEVYNEDILSRPGIQQLLGCEKECDCVLVERVWALSRQWPMLRGFLKALELHGRQLESATLLWDCVSQQCRKFSGGEKPAFQPPAEPAPIADSKSKRVRKPKRLNFLVLKPHGEKA